MQNTNWSQLNSMQLGRYAEYYTKMEFASYGLDIYTSEVDDHGIDFIAKTRNGKFLDIQVKSARQYNYVFIEKEKWNIEDPDTYLALLIFENGKMPEAYLIPAIAWKTPNELLCDKDYQGLKSKPEYGLNLSKKNLPILRKFEIEEVIGSIL